MPKVPPNIQASIKWLAGLVAIFGLTACSDFDDHNHITLKSGEELFNHHCEDCHGVDGTGKLVTQTPANILTHKGRDDIISYITSNVNPERTMPVFSTMPYAEATAIANHLLRLQQQYEALPLNKKKPQQFLIEP